MSALDWPNASGSYSVATTPTIGDSTWSFAAWARTNSTDGGTILSGGDAAGTDGFAMGFDNTSNIAAVFYVKQTGGSAAKYLVSATWTPTDDTNRLIVVTCDGANYNLYVVVKGASAGTPVSDGIVGGSGFTSSAWLLGGYYPSGPTSGNLPHFMGEAAYFDYTLSEANINTLAAGINFNTLTTDPVCYWRFRDGDVATEANQGSGSSSYSASKNGTSFGTGTEFWPDVIPRILHPVTNRQLSR